MYLVFHQIISPIPLGEIRRHDLIFKLIKKVNLNRSKHLWKEDETKVSVLGFNLNVDPASCTTTEFEERM